MSLVSKLLNVLFSSLVVLSHDRLDETAVEDGSSKGGRQVEPEKEESLEEPVDREHIDNRVREELDYRKDSEDDPENSDEINI